MLATIPESLHARSNPSPQQVFILFEFIVKIKKDVNVCTISNAYKCYEEK